MAPIPPDAAQAGFLANMARGQLGKFDPQTGWIPFESKQPNIDPAIPLEIGRIVLQWTFVEQAFDTDIELLCKHPKAAQRLRGEIPNAFSKRLELWMKLLRAAFPAIPSYLARAENIRARASDLAEWRNNLVHGLVVVENDQVKIVNFRRVGRTRTAKVYAAIPRSRLLTLAQDMKLVADEVIAFGINHTILSARAAKTE